MTTLLSIIGEQPIPNLLPIRHLKPDANLLVYTRETEAVARRLLRTIGAPLDLKQHIKAPPYDLQRIIAMIQERIRPLDEVSINLTGGTKIMSLAAYTVAAERQLPMVYYESRRNCLYRYRFEDGAVQLQDPLTLDTSITLEDYLRAHLDDYKVEGYHDQAGDAGGKFEQAVDQALKSRGFETLAGVRPTHVGNQIEIDLGLRLGNKVGVMEIKTGSSSDTVKRGLDQLKMASEREFLGTYTLQFLVTAGRVGNNVKELASARHVTIIEIPNYRAEIGLTRTQADDLAAEVREKFEPRQ